MKFPQVDEFVIATVKKIVPYGAFCALDEYEGMEAFLHISEVSSRWIKNIRDFAKEDQKIVLKVINVNVEKHQVDVSLKKVSEGEKKRKIEEVQLTKRAQKMFERAAMKLKKDLPTAQKEMGQKLLEAYGPNLFPFFESLSLGEKLKIEVPANWLEIFTEIATAEIKPKIVTERYVLKLQSFAGDGVDRIKNFIKKIEKIPSKDVKISILYISAPTYYLDFESTDFKAIDKMAAKIEAFLKTGAKDEDLALASISKEEKK
jgi:translation initiation factor 2 subunit 1